GIRMLIGTGVQACALPICARVRPGWTVDRRGRVRHLPLSHAAGERAGVLLLARPRDEIDHAPLRVVRDEIAGRDHGPAPDQISDLVLAAALLRSVAWPVAKRAPLPGRRTVDREARHRHP